MEKVAPAVAEAETETAAEGERSDIPDYSEDKPADAREPQPAKVGHAETDMQTSLQWSNERASNGEPFLIGKSGGIDLVDIPQDVFVKMGIEKAPFRLTPSMVAHVYEQHKKELRLSSLEDAVEAILDVMTNFDHVRKGRENTYVFAIEGTRNKSARRAVTIVLEYDMGEWLGIKTVGYDRINNIKELPILWEKGEINSSTTGVAPANVASSQSSHGDQTDGIASNQNTGVSDDKGSETLEDKQEGGGESSEAALSKEKIEQDIISLAMEVAMAEDGEMAMEKVKERRKELEARLNSLDAESREDIMSRFGEDISRIDNSINEYEKRLDELDRTVGEKGRKIIVLIERHNNVGKEISAWDETEKERDERVSIVKEIGELLTGMSDDEILALERNKVIGDFIKSKSLNYGLDKETRAPFERATEVFEAENLRQVSESLYDKFEELPQSDGKKRGGKKFAITDVSSRRIEHAGKALSGVYHDGESKVAVSSDTHVMVVSGKDYDSRHKGKSISAKGEVLKGNYPPYKRVLPITENNIASAPMDESVEARLTSGIKVAKAKTGEKGENMPVLVKMAEGVFGMFLAGDLRNFFRAASHIGAERLELNHTPYGDKLVARGKGDDVVLVMGINPQERMNGMKLTLSGTAEVEGAKPSGIEISNKESEEKETEAAGEVADGGGRTAEDSERGSEVVETDSEDPFSDDNLEEEGPVTDYSEEDRAAARSIKGKRFSTERGGEVEIVDVIENNDGSLWVETSNRQRIQWQSVDNYIKNGDWKEVSPEVVENGTEAASESSQGDLAGSEKSDNFERDLTLEDIDSIEDESIDESVKDGARDWLEGERSTWAEMCYNTIKEYVRNTRNNSDGSGVDGDGTQLAGPASEGDVAGDGGIGREDLGVAPTDGGQDVPGQRKRRKNSKGSGRTGTRKGGADGVGRAESGESTEDGPTGGRVRGGASGRGGVDVRGQRGDNGGHGTADNAQGRADSSAEGTLSKGEETAQGMIDDALSTLRDIFKNPAMTKPGRLNDVTTLIAGLGVNAVRFLGATAKLGCGLVLKGYYKYHRWNAEMHRNFDPLLHEYTDLTDEQIAEFLRSAWDMKMSYRGQRKKVSEWAAELEVEDMRRMARMSIEEKRRLQQAAEGTEVVVGNLDNIRETLPFLLPAQHEDVEKAERQFFDASHCDREHGYGKGYMFTNGTGTGKTYTGLGIVKRFLKQGKGRVLIVTVNGTKIKDWINDAKNLGIEASMLEDTSSKGSGVVVTQYANIRQNFALLEDEFDLIVYDESHKLMENQQGKEGSTARMHHMIANRDAEAVITRRLETSEMGKLRRERKERLEELQEILNIAEKPASMVTDQERELVKESGFKSMYELENAISQQQKLVDQSDKAFEAAVQTALADEGQRAEAEAVSRKTKTVFLSASPFNTPASLDYAEGYIFAYPSKKEGESRRDRRNAFLSDRFGKSHQRNSSGDMIRMPEGKITDPEGVEEEEIGFSDHLQNDLQTMSGRTLDSAWDYSRTFPRFEMPQAAMINRAMSILNNSELKEFFKRTLFDYTYSTAFWEIVKTNKAIDRIKEHLALGRKVVVFHRRKGSNVDVRYPFTEGIQAALDEGNATQKKLARQFVEQFAPLLQWEHELDYSYPQERLLNEFVTEEERADYERKHAEWEKKNEESIRKTGRPAKNVPKLKSSRIGIFNGDEKQKDKDGAVDTFNDSESGMDILVVQTQSGKEGISLHDRDGKHQRVMLSLALPQSPIEFIQAEGRIYRVGNQSDAIFEYPLLGIDRELYDFAMKINGRSQTTENLALGSNTRGLRDSIARGALGSTVMPVSENQGKGGKLCDSRKVQQATGFDHAMSNWKEWREGESGLPYDERSIPDPLAVKLMEWSGAERGETVMVAYAGEGHAARYVPARTKLIALESDEGKLARMAAMLGGGGRKILGEAFMNDERNGEGSYSTVNKADIVVVKTKSGVQSTSGFIEHKRSIRDIRKALMHCEDSGRVIAIIPTSDLNGGNGVLKAIEEDRGRSGGGVVRSVINLPAEVFGEETSVLIIDKSLDKGIVDANASKPMAIVDVESKGDAEQTLESMRGLQTEKREIDKIAKAVKRCKGIINQLSQNPMVRTERGTKQKDMYMNRYGFYMYLTKHLLPYGGNINSLYNGFSLSFEQLNNPLELQKIAKTWAALREMTEMDEETFRDKYSYKFGKDGQLLNARDLMVLTKQLIEAFTGKTPTQLENISQGKVENEIKTDMTIEEFKDVYKTLDSGSEELDELAERVFAVAGKIEGLSFRLASGKVFDSHNVMAHYAPGKNAIELNADAFNSIRFTDAQKAQCILHETIHAVTCWAVARYKNSSEEERAAMGAVGEACADILAVYKAINNDEFRSILQAGSKRGDNAFYGLNDEYEMLAEMANPAFRAALKAKRLWRQLINGIKKIFGIDVMDSGEGATTAFEVLDRAINTILENYDPRAYAFYKAMPSKTEHRYAAMSRGNKKTPVAGQPNRANEKLTSGSVLLSAKGDSSSNANVPSEASAKIVKDTQRTKNNIRKFNNGDAIIETNSLSDAIRTMGSLFSMRNRGGSRYTILQTDGGNTVAVRLSDHVANGNNFEQDNADNNLSIVIERRKFDAKPSEIEFTEATIPLSTFEAKPKAVVDAIVKGVEDVLADRSFTLDSTLGIVENKGVEKSYDPGKKLLEESAEVDGEPTEAQKAAGNYKKEHLTIDGHKISIENKKGSVRRGIDSEGKQWSTEMHNDYGYIRGTEGVDGDHIDVFLSETPERGDVFVIDQYNPDGSFDEHKVMYGFQSEEAARSAYLSNYEEGWENSRRLDVTHVDKDEFKKWVKSSKRKTKAFAEYRSVKVIEGESAQKIISNLNNGLDAYVKIANGAEAVVNAMRRDELSEYGGTPEIMFEFGKPGDPYRNFKGGYGISHIGSKHGVKSLVKVVEVIASGYVDRFVPGNKTVILSDGEYEVVLALTKNGQRQSWLLTGWDKITTGENGKVSANTASTQANPTFSRDDLGAVVTNVAKLVNNFDNPTVNTEEKFNDNSEILERQGDGYGGYTAEEISYMNDPASKVMGVNRFSKRRQLEFAERERQRMRDHVEELVERLHLDNVEIVEDGSTLTGKRAKSKGFYNKRTGKITIVLSNNASVYDVEQTLLHEAVAHYGLRRMFGDHFNTFLDNVYQTATEEIRRKIAAMAARNGWDFRTATEEYLASLAEETDFEAVDNGVAGWFRQIKTMFLNMLKNLGFESFRQNSYFELTDNELRYLLWRSYQNLAEPGRFQGIMGEAADVAMQDRLGVGEYARSKKGGTFVAEPAEAVNDRFNTELGRWARGDMRANEYLTAGLPTGIMKLFMPSLPVIIRQKVLTKAAKKHGLTAEDMKNLPVAMSHPIFVFKSSGNSVSILTELKAADGNNIFVAIELCCNKQIGHQILEVNDVLTVHGREAENIVKPILENSSLVYVDKEKGLDWLSSAKSKSQAITNQDLDNATKVVNTFENPTVEEDELFRDGDFSPRDAVIARGAYERMCKSGSRQFREAMQDSMQGLKNLYEAIAETGRMEKIPDYENAYLFENRMSSMNAAEQHEYFVRYTQPMLEAIGRLTGKSSLARDEMVNYMMAKHGLERNAHMRAEATSKGEDPDRDFAGLIGLTGEADWHDAEAAAQDMVDEYEYVLGAAVFLLNNLFY